MLPPPVKERCSADSCFCASLPEHSVQKLPAGIPAPNGQNQTRKRFWNHQQSGPAKGLTVCQGTQTLQAVHIQTV